MTEPYSTQRLLLLRKLTRSVADLLRGQLRDHLATLTPLFRARSVFGDHIKGTGKETIKGADAAFKELQALYNSVAAVRPFALPKDLASPLEPIAPGLEMAPVEYVHTAKTDRQSKTVTVTSPLRWILSYAGHGPKRLRELLADTSAPGHELAQSVLHTLVLHLVLSRQPGLGSLLEALRFPVTTGKLPGLGDLPITFLSSPLATSRPPDDVIIESTEVSGMDAFEELVNPADFVDLRDPLSTKLVELARTQAGELLKNPDAS
jgi:hypothetical protein